MEYDVTKASLPSSDIVEKTETCSENASVIPTDGGVAIPKTNPFLTKHIDVTGEYDSIDCQCDTKPSSPGKVTKKAGVRTFSDSVWYVALVRTKCEQKTCDVMDTFDDKHRVNAWLPRQVVRRLNEKTGDTYRLDIHNYVFFHLSKTDERNAGTKSETLRNVRLISYVQGLLTDPATGGPARIPNFQIKRFQKMLGDCRYPTRLTTAMVSKGTRVRVIGGTLKGAVGVVEDITKAESRIYIALDCLGCATTVIKTGLVEPIEEAGIASGERVSMAEWLALHPYNEVLSVDKLYVHFANLVMAAAAEGTLCISPAGRRRLALSLTAYLEDKRTRLGLFDYFVQMRYKGCLHPLQQFFPAAADAVKLQTYMNGYDAKNVNITDIMYLLRAGDSGKSRSLDRIYAGAVYLFDTIRKSDYEQLPANKFYLANLNNLLSDNPLKGLKRLLTEMAHRLNVCSGGLFPIPDARHVFCRHSPTSPVEPLSFALQLAERMRAKAAAVRTIRAMLAAPVGEYEVAGCYRKAVHFRGADGEKRIVYLDDISAGDYQEGERYLCRLVEAEKDKWYMVEPPVKKQRES